MIQNYFGQPQQMNSWLGDIPSLSFGAGPSSIEAGFGFSDPSGLAAETRAQAAAQAPAAPTPSPSSSFGAGPSSIEAGFGFSDPSGLASQEAVNSTFGGMPYNQNYFGQPQQRNSWLGDRLSIPDAGYAPQYFGAPTMPRLPDVSSGYFGDPNAVDPQSAGATGGGGTNPYAAAALSVGPTALGAANWATGAFRDDGKNLATLGKEYIKGTDIYKSMVGVPYAGNLGLASSAFPRALSGGVGGTVGIGPSGMLSADALAGLSTTALEAWGGAGVTPTGLFTTGPFAGAPVTGVGAPSLFGAGTAAAAEGGLGLSGGLGAASEFGAGGFAGVTPAPAASGLGSMAAAAAPALMVAAPFMLDAYINANKPSDYEYRRDFYAKVRAMLRDSDPSLLFSQAYAGGAYANDENVASGYLNRQLSDMGSGKYAHEGITGFNPQEQEAFTRLSPQLNQAGIDADRMKYLQMDKDDPQLGYNPIGQYSTRPEEMNELYDLSTGRTSLTAGRIPGISYDMYPEWGGVAAEPIRKLTQQQWDTRNLPDGLM